MSDGKDVEKVPEGVYPKGEGLGGTANKGFPSTAGLTGDQRPVQYTNVRPQSEDTDAPEPTVVGKRKGMFGATQGGDTSGYGGLRSPILFPGESERPYGGYFDALVDHLAEATGPAMEGVTVVADRGELTLYVERDQLLTVMSALRDDPRLRFEMCMSVSGVHFPQETGRELHVAYHLLSITHGSRRLRVEVTAPDADPHVPSVVGIYPAADWHERETWDMFGIVFDGHPALTRILMPDDWPGHPQRKDYPLGGIPVEYKGGTVPPPDQRRSYT
ncbi:NADH-quinone oxidoreductase subunit C [Janibacter sp. GXQ6167]|uniref:NADH-quinone oxidoreductase subunit C n=1 Tax=Janibacter sp. GXQ6167 TaxID=3240791 RepID=UPI0035261DB4